MKATDIEQYIVDRAPPEGGDEGFRWGDPGADVTGVLIAWMATVPAIEKAAAEGCNVMVVHEDVFFPYESRGRPEKWMTWGPNRARLQRLAQHGLTVIRAHGMLDRLCILDDFAKQLGLPEPSVREGYVRIYDIETVSVRQLAEQVKERMGLRAVRVCGDLDKLVSRVGLPWGGLGLSVNMSFIQSLLVHEPGALIAGEMDEYAMWFVADVGVPMIETSHCASENRGLENFADMLRSDFPDLKVVFFDVGEPSVNV